MKDTIKEADARRAHARGCKKALDSCETCRTNIAWFNNLPRNVLSIVLAEPGTHSKLRQQREEEPNGRT